MNTPKFNKPKIATVNTRDVATIVTYEIKINYQEKCIWWQSS